MNDGLFITTATGKRFYFDDIENNVIDIEDIAHSLARVCRFGGHVRTFDSIYSVAQHSILCAIHIQTFQIAIERKEIILATLLHDAAEAYIGDMTGPLKMLFPEYKTLERRVERAIEKHFHLCQQIFEHPSIKTVDLRLRRNEANSFCYGEENLCASTDAPDLTRLDINHLQPWPIQFTQEKFLEYFYIYQQYVQPLYKHPMSNIQ